MATLEFNGFGANMFAPSYGAESLERAFTKFAIGQWSISTPTPTLLEAFTNGPDPNITFQILGSFNYATDATIDASRVSTLHLSFSQPGGGAPGEVTISNVNLTMAGVAKVGLSTGLFAGNDIIKGSAFGDILRGFAGNDTMFGGGGADYLIGDAGNDTLNGGTDVGDQLAGGIGDDTYKLTRTDDVIVERAGEGIDRVEAGVSYTLAANSNVENLTLTGTGDINGTGNELANVITGNAGANILDGGAGADTMTGGAGNDTYVVDNTLDKVQELIAGVPGGTDTVESSVTYTLGLNVENLTLTGGAAPINATGNTLANTLTGNDGNNVLLGLAGDDTLVGGEGDDTLDGGLGNDAMAGGAGNDTYVLDNALGDAITEFLGDGNDTARIAYGNATLTPVSITLGSGIYSDVENLTVTGTGLFNLTGDTGDNILTGNASVNTLTGGNGNDTLDGGLGNDILDGGDGNDTYILNGADTISFDSAGNDTVMSALTYSIETRADLDNITLLGAAVINATGNAGVNILTGNAAANTLNGGAGNDTLVGDAGNDTLNGGADNDTMIGGAGNDTYVVDSTLDVTTEAPGAAGGVDLVQASVSRALGNNSNVENLTLTGTGDINGTGNELANVITGNAGANILDGGAGADTMTGGAGNDTYVVDNTLDKVQELIAGVPGGTDTVESSVTYTLGLNVENLTLTGGAAPINATGNTLANTLTGNDGNNVLLGLAGDDTLVGGEGDDTLDGGLGNDAMAGGAGNDTYVLDNALGDAITEFLGDGNDTARIAYGNATLTPVSITLGSGIYSDVENLTVTGTGLFNLTGDTGDNILTGNASVNTLTGGNGNDTLDGGLGNDILDGGDGNDTYVLSAAGDTIIDSSGDDTISAAFSLDLNTRPGMENITLLGAVAINATGNAGVNILTGNAAANILNGGAGNDTLVGDAGNDTLNGGADNDTMIGGAGNDTYVVDSTLDVTTEAPGAAGGVDLVQASVSRALGNNSNVENLTLTGTGDINGTGNELANVITGNAGANILDGGAGADTMTGGAGNDTYVVDNTLDKVQELIAGVPGGTDTVESSVTYTLGLNVENLTLTGGAAPINATGNTLANTLTGNDGNNVLLGLAGDDTLVGGEGDDTLDGGLGNDAMAGGAGNDTYVLDNALGDAITEFLGDGNDTARIAYGNATLTPVSITLGSGIYSDVENLTVTGTGLFNLTGDTGDNILTGNASVNTLTGGNGNDTLDGGLGNDILDGGDGNDTYILNGADTISFDSAGNDTVMSALTYSIETRADLDNITLLGAAVINATGNAGVNILTGNAAANTLNGGAGNDTLVGDAGNDTLNGGADNDTMIGGAGNDTYVVDSTLDVTTEAPGAAGGVDLVQASVSRALGNNSNVENLTLTGTGDINGTGNELANVITGNAGANILDGGAGADTMTGGAGNDTYVVDNTLDKVQELIAGVPGGTDTVESSVTYTLGLNVENLTLTGGAAPINATGNTLANTLTGNDGNNVLLGLAGDDTLVGGEGDDTLDGGLGNDAMAGGAGNDTYVLDNALGDAITEFLGDGNDTARIAYGNATLTPVSITLGSGIYSDVENLTVTGTGLFNLTGDTGDNILTGNASVNTLTGGNGNDTLDGGLGNDILDGGDGNDTYVLSAAGDTIIDSSGDDTISAAFSLDLNTRPGMENITLLGAVAINATGNAGVNILTGNAAANILNGGAGADTMIGGAGNDTYVVDNALDVTTEAPGAAGGVDLVQASVSRALGNNSNVENLTLTGTGDINGTGNELANVITGNAGANILDGGAGADTMTGGAGNDTYVVDNTLDKVQELIAGVPGGTDTVESSVTYTLGLNVENLTLTGGAAPINATGNTLANTLTGNDGNNVLDGGTGADHMVGGLGNDTYFIDNTGDVVTEEADAGTDQITIRGTPYPADFSYFLPAGVENLTYSGSAIRVQIIGNELDNVLIGAPGVPSASPGYDIIYGGDGNDWLDGRGSLFPEGDRLVGGAGDDTYVIGSLAATEIWEDLGQGSDTVIVGFSFDVDYFTLVNRSAATAPLDVEIENIILTGSANIDAFGNSLDNHLTGNAGRNLLVGEDGNDTLDGGAGIDTLIGGDGDDRFVFDPVDVIIELADQGSDTIVIARNTDLRTEFANFESIELTGITATTATGNDGDNHLTGNALDNVLQGYAGNDTLNGGAGADTMVGGIGNDVFVFDNPGDVAVELPGEGNDTLFIGRNANLTTEFANLENVNLTGAGNFSITGNGADNHLVGNGGSNVLSGGGGNDYLDGGQGADDMSGGTGNDTYVMDHPGDVFHENPGEGSDTILVGGRNVDLTDAEFDNIENVTLTGTGAFNLTGDASDNILVGTAGMNILIGNDGNDILDGGAGNDNYDGGAGNDIYILTQGDVIAADLSGTDTVQADFVFSLFETRTDLENFTATGTAWLNFRGNSQNNVLVGNEGNNTIFESAGEDTMYGNAGDDSYWVNSAGDVAIETISGAAGGIDTVTTTVSYTLGANIENLTLFVGLIDGTGNELANLLVGTNNQNTLIGLEGNDTFRGGGGGDTMFGGDGDDTFEYFFDIVDGGAGMDSLRPLVNGQTINLSAAGTGIKGIEMVDLKTGFGGERLDLTAAEVVALSDTSNRLLVRGDFNDQVHSELQGWVQGAVTMVEVSPSNFVNFNTYTTVSGAELAELYVETSIGSQNVFIT